MRLLCAQCRYPQARCFCGLVESQSLPFPVILLQHPHEAQHAKSTVPLLRQALPDVQVCVGEHPADFAHLLPFQNASGWWCLYPEVNALNVDTELDSLPLSWDKSPGIEGTRPLAFFKGLVVLDGTWRKTRKMRYLNPWLTALPALTFSKAPESRYVIRKGPGQGALSTLESLAHVLDVLSDDFSPDPLLFLLNEQVRRIEYYQKRSSF